MLRTVRAEGRCLAFRPRDDVEHEIATRLLGQILEGRRVPRWKQRRPHQPRDDVRLAGFRMPASIGGGRNRIAGETADRDVIGMQVETVRIERRDHVRPNAANQRHERSANLVRRSLGQLAVAVVEQLQLVEADDPRRLSQLALAERREIFGLAQRRIARFATFTASGRHQHGARAFGRVLHGGSRPRKALIVGMGKAEQDAEPGHQRNWVSTGRSMTHEMVLALPTRSRVTSAVAANAG